MHGPNNKTKVLRNPSTSIPCLGLLLTISLIASSENAFEGPLSITAMVI